MKFDDLDKKLRVFETSHDCYVLPGIYMVARLDGRGFTRLAREVHHFEAPFDTRFRDCMIFTTEHLMNCGFRVIYGYTQSDEISLLLHREEGLFRRKLRKLVSVLAGEASAAFSSRLGSIACLDCRISQLPSPETVVEYFRWRQEDAMRNALNAYCYWTLRKESFSMEKATTALLGLGIAEKNELLSQRGIDFNETPLWQRRGVGVYWDTVRMEGQNRQTGLPTQYSRRRLKVDLDLPMGEEYETLLEKMTAEASKSLSFPRRS
ncbi:guanylyltransferase [Spartobacteria bacterium LR76]|nr:guanylyltransferase [Spartobacteria bacterium LR76]